MVGGCPCKACGVGVITIGCCPPNITPLEEELLLAPPNRTPLELDEGGNITPLELAPGIEDDEDEGTTLPAGVATVVVPAAGGEEDIGVLLGEDLPARQEEDDWLAETQGAIPLHDQ